MACSSCSKSKKKKKSSSVAGVDAINIEAAVGAAVGGMAGGYVDKMLANEKDATGAIVPITDTTNWRADPVKRSGVILGLGIGAMFASTYVEDQTMAQAAQGVGQGMCTYGAYGIARETVFKKEDNTYMIAGTGTAPYPMQSIAGYIPPASIATAYPEQHPAQHMDHQSYMADVLTPGL